jgi:hypothetical protein
MVTYCYAWTPLVILGTVAMLALPWLGLIALGVILFGSFVLLAGLTWAIVQVPLRLTRAVHRRWHHHGTDEAPAGGTVFDHSGRPSRSVPVGATVLIANPPSEGDR